MTTESTTPPFTTKGRVALEPFPDMSVKTQTAGEGRVKVVRIENQAGLVRLKIVLNSEDLRFRSGYFAYVRGNQYTQHWAKEVHSIADQRFILVPDAMIEVVACV